MPDPSMDSDISAESGLHACRGDAGPPIQGQAMVVCFTCFRTGRTPPPAAAAPAGEPDKMLPAGAGLREPLTPRDIAHRRRMLDWLRQA